MSDRFLTNQEKRATNGSNKKGRPHCVVRHQNTTVPIYAGDVHGKVQYTVAFYLDGRRERRMFTDLDEAKREAKLAAQKIQKGLHATNDLRPAERESYLVAQRTLKGLDVPLTSAVEEYAKCRERLGDIPLLTADRDDRRSIEQMLQRLSQKARASGIHVIVATQKPSAEVISTTVRSNLPAQLALRVKTGTDSRIVMDELGAEALAGKGDALLKTARRTVRLQCAAIAQGRQ